MNSVTKSVLLTALAGSLAISAPAPASAFSRGGGGFHGGGFHAGGFGAATVGMAVKATVIPPTATKSAATTIGQPNPVQHLLRRLLTLDVSASPTRVCASGASAAMPVPTA
jgi:hypothetical protein